MLHPSRGPTAAQHMTQSKQHRDRCFEPIDTNNSKGKTDLPFLAVESDSRSRGPTISSVVRFYLFIVAVVFRLLLCCVVFLFLFLFSGGPVMWVSIREGHFDRSVVRPVELFYPVPRLVLTGLSNTF